MTIDAPPLFAILLSFPPSIYRCVFFLMILVRDGSNKYKRIKCCVQDGSSCWRHQLNDFGGRMSPQVEIARPRRRGISLLILSSRATNSFDQRVRLYWLLLGMEKKQIVYSDSPAPFDQEFQSTCSTCCSDGKPIAACYLSVIAVLTVFN